MKDGTRDKGIDRTAAQLMQSYLPVQYAFVQFFTEHLADLNRVFEQDLQEMLVLAIVGQRRLEVALAGNDIGREGPARACISASRISDVAHMPRQTVRRKLLGLQARGWVDCEKGQGWFIPERNGSSAVRDALKDFELRFAQRLARLHLQLLSVTKS